jgi:hypothetical protein
MLTPIDFASSGVSENGAPGNSRGSDVSQVVQGRLPD